ncbi:MAG: (deoxy)nucleoside triphosphate pyrophosphohydrolase [Pseudomonadota bacterium]
MTKVLLVAACAMIDGDGRVLIAQRPEGKEHSGLWEFPGGKVEDGETPEDALIRELKEELGVNVTASCLAPFAFASEPLDQVHLLMPLYLCRKWAGIPSPIVAQRLKWVAAHKMISFDFVPADRPLAAQLRDYLEPF